MRCGAPARFAVSEFRGPAIAGAHAMADARTAVWSQRIVVVATGRGSYCVRTAGVDFWGGVGGLGGLSQMSQTQTCLEGFGRARLESGTTPFRTSELSEATHSAHVHRLGVLYSVHLGELGSWVDAPFPLRRGPMAGFMRPTRTCTAQTRPQQWADAVTNTVVRSRRHPRDSCLQVELSPPRFGVGRFESRGRGRLGVGATMGVKGMAPPPRRWFGQNSCCRYLTYPPTVGSIGIFC
jgi:hypothetical protein